MEAKEIWSHCLLVIYFLKPLLPFVYPQRYMSLLPFAWNLLPDSTSLTDIFNDAVRSFIVEKVLSFCVSVYSMM